MLQDKLYLYIISFILGVTTRSFFDLGYSFIILFLVLSGVFFLNFLFRKGKVFLTLGFVFVLFAFGLLRFELSITNPEELPLNTSLGESIALEGVIVREVDQRENSNALILEPSDHEGKILIVTENFSGFSYGDIISVKGLLEKPENFLNENQKEFDYINYLAKDDIFYQMFFPEIGFINSGGGNFLKRKLFGIKNILISNARKVIPSPESEYLSGLLFGVEDSLGKELENDFRRTGLIHVVVLSGYNISLVADAIMKTFSFLPLLWKSALGSLGIVFFAIMTGGGATTIRASIMALLVVLARITGRDYDVTRALFLAGGLMVLHSPEILVFDPSFQLSFMATLGLIYLSPKVIGHLKFLPSKWQIRELAGATVATQLFVLPILLFKIGDLSLISPLANLLVLPFIPLTMLFGFLTSVVGLVSSFISLPLAAISYAFLHYQVVLVETFSSIPFASITIKTFPIWALILVYLIYLFLIRRISTKK